MIKNKRVPEDKAKVIMQQLVSAIKYFHSKNIVHRDLKLDNMMLAPKTDDDEELRMCLIDFGLSKLTESQAKDLDGENTHMKSVTLSTFCGTIDFMSPEILEGKQYDSSTDMWSCGVIAYFMLSGEPPFLGKSDKQVQSNITTVNFGFD